jgi:hypothetical protein
LAGRVVTLRLRGALGLLLLGTAGCSSFDPATGTRFKLLNKDSYDELDMPDARWVAYDDQHSNTFSCTNGAAGNHKPEECSIMQEPSFDWEGPKRMADRGSLDQGKITEHDTDGIFEPICVRGLLRHNLPCDPLAAGVRCYEGDGRDVSNMWGAGVGLTFSVDGKIGWDAESHHVRGVAFEFDGTSDTMANFRVGIPTVLDADTPVPTDHPLIRSDGTVIGIDGQIYDWQANVIGTSAHDTLGNANVDGGSTVVTSDQHPNGSPFWQLGPTPGWVPSPVVKGQNRFDLREVLPPPLATLPVNKESYSFAKKSRILGIHFQVVHQNPKSLDDIEFSFCIKNLAFTFD